MFLLSSLFFSAVLLRVLPFRLHSYPSPIFFFRPLSLFLSLATRPLYLSTNSSISCSLSLSLFLSLLPVVPPHSTPHAIRRRIFFLALSLISPIHVRLMYYRGLTCATSVRVKLAANSLYHSSFPCTSDSLYGS